MTDKIIQPTKIMELVRQSCALEEENIRLDTKLNEISLDSLSFISLIVNLEQEFDMEFDDEELNIYDWETVQEIVNLVEEKINEKSGK